MIDPASVCLFIPPGLKNFKLNLFESIGEKILSHGGMVLRHDFDAVGRLPQEVIPIIGGSPELRPTFTHWRAVGRPFVTWDRGYARRIFATWLPRGQNGGYYRWHVGSWQMQTIRDVPSDRWDALKIPVAPWSARGRHIVVAEPSPTYQRVHGIEGWTQKTLAKLASLTKRPIVVRSKETRRPLQKDLARAHCLVTHGSIAAVEAVILGCPVFVHPDSAAALVGKTDLNEIETPAYPDRKAWLNSLAYSQFTERELVDGTLWRLLSDDPAGQRHGRDPGRLHADDIRGRHAAARAAR
jgi:hypothetical protein